MTDEYQKFKVFYDTLSLQEKENISDAFKNALNELLQAETLRLQSIEKDIQEVNQFIEESREKSKKDGYNYALFEERNKKYELKKFLEKKLLNQKNIVECLQNGGILTTITDKKDTEHPAIPDFRKIPTEQIAFDEKTILVEPKPSYIPHINTEQFARRGFVFDAIRIEKDSYILAIEKHEEAANTFYVIVTLDQLVLIADYYFTLAKANNIKVAEEQTARNEQYYDSLSEERRKAFLFQKNLYPSLPVKVKKQVTEEEWDKLDLAGKEALYKPFKKRKAKRLTSKLGSTQMWTSFHKMYERFVNPKVYLRNSAGQPDPSGRIGDPEVFMYWYMFRDMMNFKIKDIQIQRQDLSENYQQAIETSFGDSNTDTVLKEKYGILVKRQNGDKINPSEISQIETAWKSVQKVFGNLKPNALKYNLKISHAGKRLIFASKAVGAWVQQMGTIAVSDKYGNEQFTSTMSHEVAHFIDFIVGNLNGKRYATDDYESTAGILAFTFRNNMNKPSKEQTDYINATKECFARALQQYFGIKRWGEQAGIKHSYFDLEEIKPFYYIDHFVNKENFDTKIVPLIEQFLQEQQDIFDTTLDLDESDELAPVGTEEPILPDDIILALKTLKKYSSKEINEKIQTLLPN